MNKFFIVFALVVCASCSTSEDVNPSDTFVKFYGDKAAYELKDMIFTTDNQGLILFGSRTGVKVVDSETVIDSVFSRFFLIQVDITGKVIRRREYGFEFGVEASRIKAVADGYLVIGTQITDVSTRVVWGSMNENFEQPSFEAYGPVPSSHYYGVDISETSDGGVVLAGYTDVNGTNDLFYSKIGGTLPEWDRVQTRLGSDDRLIRSMPYENGGLVLVGRTDTPSDDGEGGINVERTIISSDGVIVNSGIYGITNLSSPNWDDTPYDVIEKPGGFAIVGISEFAGASKPFVMLVDLTGASSDEVIYETEFPSGSNAVNAGANAVTLTKTNDLFISGTISDFLDPADGGQNKGDELFVMRADQDGTALNAFKNYGLINGEERAVRALTAPDGSIFIGATYDFGPGVTQFALLKMNVEGELKQ